MLRFFIATFAWTWLITGVVILSGVSVGSAPGFLLLTLGAFGPTLVGIVLVGRTATPSQKREFWSRVISPTRIRPMWWVVAILLFPALIATGIVLDHLTGAAPLDLSRARATVVNPLALIGFAVIMLITGPFAEELGWRGYALPRLQQR